MEWSSSTKPAVYADLATPVEKTGATESVLFVAILWGIAIVIAIN